MKKFLLCFAALLLAVMFAGCAADIIDELSPSDLTLEDLEKRMNQASDPQGVFAASSSYAMRQEVVEEFLLNEDEVKMVELKFEKPDRMALITYDDNQPDSVFCTDGKRGWLADYGSRKVMQLGETGLKRMMTLASLGTPGGGGFKNVFKKVEVHKCTNEEGSFYRIDCFGEESPEPIRFYLDSKTFLTRKVTMKLMVAGGGSVDYSNRIMEYDLRDGVMVPMKTIIEQNGVTQKSKVIFFHLNPKFREDEFLPPVFAAESRRSLF